MKIVLPDENTTTLKTDIVVITQTIINRVIFRMFTLLSDDGVIISYLHLNYKTIEKILTDNTLVLQC